MYSEDPLSLITVESEQDWPVLEIKYQIRKLNANKKTIADFTELAIQAFDQRDEAQSKIVAMRERNEKDARHFAEEMKELQRTLDHDEKLKDFLFHKSNDRVFAADFGEDDKGKAKRLEEERIAKEAAIKAE